MKHRPGIPFRWNQYVPHAAVAGTGQEFLGVAQPNGRTDYRDAYVQIYPLGEQRAGGLHYRLIQRLY